MTTRTYPEAHSRAIQGRLYLKELLKCGQGDIPRTPPPARPALPLYVQTPGARITKRGFTLAIQVENEPDVVVALDEVSELVLAGPLALTTPAVHELSRREVPVAWL